MIFETENGIWYEIFIHERIFVEFLPLAKTQTQKEIFVYHQISENGQSLFGFLSVWERNFFKELIKISGIGGKAAQLILWLGIENIAWAIQERNQEIFESVKGIGKKVAAKIINELQDNKTILSYQYASSISVPKTPILWDKYTSIVSSLVHLWYSEKRILEELADLPWELEEMDEIIAYLVKNI